MARKLKRTRPGHYQTTLEDGATVEVEYVDFRWEFGHGYSDHGWVWRVNGTRSDFPVNTKRYAVELLEHYLENQRAETEAYLAERWA